jgi:hypothetical protein
VREPTVASPTTTAATSVAAATYAGPGSSWPPSRAIATAAIRIGTMVTTPRIAVRRPVLGTTIARSSTMNDAYSRHDSGAICRSRARNAEAPNDRPVLVA